MHQLESRDCFQAIVGTFCNRCKTPFPQLAGERTSKDNEWTAPCPAIRIIAEDKREIIELGILWDSAYDALDFESWMSIWADDKECIFASNAFGERHGIDDMRDYYTNYKKTFSGLRHVLSNDLVVGDGSTARHYCYLCVYERITGTSMLGSAVFYSHLRKINGYWKFVRRDQVADPGMAFNPAAQTLMAKFGNSDK